MSAYVVARLNSWADWQTTRYKSLGFPSSSAYAPKHRLAGDKRRKPKPKGPDGQPRPLTAQGKESLVVKGDIADPGWSPEIEQTETVLSRLRRERPILAFVLIAEHLGWVPNGRGGWRAIEYKAVQGMDAHRRKLGALLGLGPRAFSNTREAAYLWMEGALGWQAA